MPACSKRPGSYSPRAGPGPWELRSRALLP